MGLGMLAIGVYMVGPWYAVLPNSTAFGLLNTIAPLYFKSVAAMNVVTGLFMIYGGFKGNNVLTNIAIWCGVSVFTLTVVTRLLIIGWIPVIWVYHLMLLLITATLALTEDSRR